MIEQAVNLERKFWQWYNRPIDVNNPMPEPPKDDTVIAFFGVFIPALILASVLCGAYCGR